MNGEPFCKKCKENMKEKAFVFILVMLIGIVGAFAILGFSSFMDALEENPDENCVEWEPKYGQCHTGFARGGMVFKVEYNGTQYEEPRLLVDKFPGIEVVRKVKTNCEVIRKQCVRWREKNE